jgi:hypothetical protein
VSDGSNLEMATTADKYYMGPPAGEIWAISRMIMFIEDSGHGDTSDYGAGSALTNGVQLYITRGGPDGTTILDLMDGGTVKTNGGWAALCFDLAITAPGAGNPGAIGIAIRYTFAKSGALVVLCGHRDEKIVMNIQDSLTGLVTQTAFIQGYREA